MKYNKVPVLIRLCWQLCGRWQNVAIMETSAKVRVGDGGEPSREAWWADSSRNEGKRGDESRDVWVRTRLLFSHVGG